MDIVTLVIINCIVIDYLTICDYLGLITIDGIIMTMSHNH